MSDLVTILLAFIGIWLGATLAIKPIDEIAKNFNSSSFIISFFVLGLFTSLTEVSVAVNSYLNDSVEISIGNLLGGSLVLLLFVIPLLGILTNGINLKGGFCVRNTFFAILYLFLPHILLIDKNLSLVDSIILFASYILLAITLYLNGKKNVHLNKSTRPHINSSKIVMAIIFVAVGSVILILSSNILVNSIDRIGTNLNISPFILALLGLSLGTNLPEISLAIISAIKGRSDIGFGNYLGSAVFNPFILSLLGIASGGALINEDFTKLLIFSLIGFLLFFIFTRSKNYLSRQESSILLLIYIMFVLAEILIS